MKNGRHSALLLFNIKQGKWKSDKKSMKNMGSNEGEHAMRNSTHKNVDSGKAVVGV